MKTQFIALATLLTLATAPAFADGSLTGTVGGGAMESRVIDAAREALNDGKTRLLSYDLLEPERGDPGVCGGEVQIYLEPYMPPHTVVVIGAGHVGKAVVELAHWLGFRTIVTDDRAEEVVALGDRFAST